ncbi:hypothetical protein JCM8097_007886 [Rhodosporidiobolus ruineniae]
MARSRPPEEDETPPVVAAVEATRGRYLLGTGMLLVVVLMWISASFLMNRMFTDMDYDKPFLVTYLCTSTFSLYLVKPAIQYCKTRRLAGDKTVHGGLERRQSKDTLGSVNMSRPLIHRRRDTNRSLSRARPSRNDMGRHLPLVPVDPPLTVPETAQLALLFCGLWFCANWAMNAALGYTSVSSTTILSSMSGFFTLAAGACAGVESFTVGKLLSVVLSVTGVAIVSLSDSKLPTPPSFSDPSVTIEPSSTPAYSNPLLGDALALLSAVAYAAYVLLLKVRIRNENRISMTLFFGFVGAWCIVLFPPLGWFLHKIGVETFEFPRGGALWASLAVNAGITFVSDALYLRAMLLTSPLAVTLGLSLTIPLAMAGDLYRHAPVGAASLIGGVLVLSSFIGNGILDLKEAEKQTVEFSGRQHSTSTRTAALPRTVSDTLAAHAFRPLLGSNSSSPPLPADPTTLNCWVRSVRRQKNISFAVVSDGTVPGGVQVVLPKGVGDGLTVGCSASFRGEWVETPGRAHSREFRADEVEVLGDSDAAVYPMPNTKQGIPPPLMRKNAHLRLRKEQAAAMVRLRSEMNFAMAQHFREREFVRVELPLITSSDCEGAGEVFRVVESSPSTPPPASTASASSPPPPIASPDSSSSAPPPAPSRYLTVSTQLHLEAITSSLPRAYTLSPCFRAEKSDTARHLQEFWMLEAEVAFLDVDVPTALEQVMSVAEDSVRGIAKHVRALPDFQKVFAVQDPTLTARVDALLDSKRWPRMTYTRAVELLQEHAAANPKAFVFAPIWGAGLQTEHERWLAEEHVKGPLFVTDYPTPLKPFYMLPNEPSSSSASASADSPSSPSTDSSASSRQTTACFDLLVPQLGELAGGSLREHRPSALLSSLERAGLDADAYDWYLDLRRYGTTRHGGFGMGWERLVGLLTGEGNVRECIPFPRAAEGSRF